MENIKVHRYKNKELQKSWQGYVEPNDLSWIMFIDSKGHVTLHDKRDPITGAVLTN